MGNICLSCNPANEHVEICLSQHLLKKRSVKSEILKPRTRNILQKSKNSEISSLNASFENNNSISLSINIRSKDVDIARRKNNCENIYILGHHEVYNFCYFQELHSGNCDIFIENKKVDFNSYYNSSKIVANKQDCKIRVKLLLHQKIENANGMFDNCKFIGAISLANFDSSRVQDMSCMFQNCYELEVISGLSRLNTQQLRSMAGMFRGCVRLTEADLSSFMTGGVKNMSGLFYNCHSLRCVHGLNKLCVNEAWNLSHMFYGCRALAKLDLGAFYTRNLEDMSHMFAGCCNLIEIRGLDMFITEGVKNMEAVFADCKKLRKLTLRNFNFGDAKNISRMFFYCETLEELALGDFSLENVCEYKDVFYGCNKLRKIEFRSISAKADFEFKECFRCFFGLHSIVINKRPESFLLKRMRDFFGHGIKIEYFL